MRWCVSEVELILLLPDWIVMMMDCLCVAEWNTSCNCITGNTSF